MTNVGQAFLALLAGFSATAVVVIVVTAVLQKSVPGWVGTGARPRPAYVVVNLGYSFLAAAAGGYVTAWIAGWSAARCAGAVDHCPGAGCHQRSAVEREATALVPDGSVDHHVDRRGSRWFGQAESWRESLSCSSSAGNFPMRARGARNSTFPRNALQT